MTSNSMSHRRTILRRPIVCKSKLVPPVEPPPGYYSCTVVPDSPTTPVGVPCGFSVLPEADVLPIDDPVNIDYLVDDGDLTGPATVPNYTEDYGTWTGSAILGDHWLYCRASFSNGAIAWGKEVVEVVS